MGTLAVQLKPNNEGFINLEIATQSGETIFSGNASFENPIDQEWSLESGIYTVRFEWSEGYQNIHHSSDGNNIFVNGQYQIYQLLGAPGDVNGIQVMYAYNV